VGWTSADLPDLTGRRIVVTGATSGIGVAAAAALARAGAHVVLAVRDTARGASSAARMTGSTEVRELDLTDLASVRRFADGLDGPLDVLINNAGVMVVPRGRTKDGFETHIGTNHLGHFALTNLLLPRITDRVVTVASLAHRFGRVDPSDLSFQSRRYLRWSAYAQSKLANLLFTTELAHRLGAVGSPVRAMACHPGYSATRLGKHTGNFVVTTLLTLGDSFAQDAAAGALPTLHAATVDLPTDSYVGPHGPGEMRGYPGLVGRSGRACDVDLSARLWRASEALTGTTFPLGVGSAS
jgi:NAD(P)-dependent dehydrogenase (short-subunit alcohol dehydrogenase family)